jgi:hypothetical protein
MPLHHTILLFLAAASVAWLCGLWVPRLQGDLRRVMFWCSAIALAAILSALSGLVSAQSTSGTGWVTRHGWPKPFLFQNTSEAAERSWDFSAVYYGGNGLAHLGFLLLAWTSCRVLHHLLSGRRSAEAPGRSSQP